MPENDGRWISDISGKAAIFSCGDLPYEAHSNKQYSGFVYAKINGIYIFSCYMSPNEPIDDFQACLHSLCTVERGKSPLVVAGDFNAWATDWGSTVNNSRGRALLKSFATLDVVLLNDGNNPSFDNGRATSTIDFTFAFGHLVRSTRLNVSQRKSLWLEC